MRETISVPLNISRQHVYFAYSDIMKMSLYSEAFLFVLSVRCYARSDSDRHLFEWLDYIWISGAYIVKQQVSQHGVCK